MRKLLFLLTAGSLTILFFSVALWSVVKVEADNPHLPWLDVESCWSCHDADDEGQIDGSEFIDAMIEFCYKCHPPSKLGRSHPVSIDLDRNWRFPEMSVPDNLLVGGQWEDLLTCATCHYIHGPWKSRVKAYRSQEPIQIMEFTSPMYSTLFLRIPGNPDGGWEELCDACHAGYL